MQSSFTDIGFLLKQLKYKEADKIIFIFSRYHGVVELVAKGARKQTSRKSGHLDTLNLVKFHTARSHTPQIISQVETIDSFLGNKCHLTNIKSCFLISELLFSLLPMQQPDQSLFISLHNFLSHLDDLRTNLQIQKLTNEFCNYLIRHLGYPKAKSNTPSALYSHLESIMDSPIQTISLFS